MATRVLMIQNIYHFGALEI